MHVLDVISYTDTGVKTGTIKGIPTDRSVRTWILHGTYTVTDAAISAGENFDGYISLLRVMGNLKKTGKDVEIIRAERDELTKHCNFLPPDGLSQYYMGTPTTAQEERFWAAVGLPHDLTIYSQVWLEWTSQAAITEWGGASAMANVRIALDLITGPVERSFIAGRFYRSSDTVHDFSVGDGTIFDIVAFPGTSNYIQEVNLPGSDGVMDWVLQNGYTIPGKVMYDVLRGSVSTADDVDAVRSGPILNEYYPDRQLHVLMNTAATLLVLTKTAIAVTEVSSKTTAGQAARGEVVRKSQTVNVGGIFKAETGRKLAATPMNQLINTQAMDWFKIAK